MAQTVANDMVKDKEKALKAAQNAKSKGGATIAEKITSEQERKLTFKAQSKSWLSGKQLLLFPKHVSKRWHKRKQRQNRTLTEEKKQ